MVQIQGLKIAATVIAFVLALSTVNVLAAQAGIAIQLNADGISTEDIRDTNERLGSTNASGIGSQDPGFFGIAVGMTQTFQQVFALTTNLGTILQGFGVPAIIGNSVQIMVNFTVGVAAYQILRATVF